MKTAAEYRAMAEECYEWARKAHTEEVRESYMQLAQVWLNAASFVDGGPPTRKAGFANQSRIVLPIRALTRARDEGYQNGALIREKRTLGKSLSR